MTNKWTDLEQYSSAIQETSTFLLNKFGDKPGDLVIIGSGLGELVELLEERQMIPYADIPHFPVSTVAGHSGELHWGRINGRLICIMKGRFHLYEGYHSRQVAFPVWSAQACGINNLLVTNAAGGINPHYEVGDIMLIRDQINWMFKNPLIGPIEPKLGERFPDMSDCYSAELRRRIHKIAAEKGIRLQEGTYLASTGPYYETKAEIAMLRTLGADAVGMSTIPEALVAAACNIPVMGFSYISNVHRLGVEYYTSHKEVMENARLVTQKLRNLLCKWYSGDTS